jgi:hypothetical protein
MVFVAVLMWSAERSSKMRFEVFMVVKIQSVVLQFWHHIVLLEVTRISEENAASIFGVGHRMCVPTSKTVLIQPRRPQSDSVLCLACLLRIDGSWV